MGTRTFTVTVKLTVDEAADPQEIVQEMDYNFHHEHIRDSEIIDADFPDDT
jgi:hypothetical protein